MEMEEIHKAQDGERLKDIDSELTNSKQFHHVKTIGRLAVALA